MGDVVEPRCEFIQDSPSWAIGTDTGGLSNCIKAESKA
jgi:hypothetical protein